MGAGISFQEVTTRIQRADPLHGYIRFRTRSKKTCIADVYRFDRQHYKHVERPELFIEHCVVTDKGARAQIAFYERGQFAPCAPYVDRISRNQIHLDSS